MLFVYLLIFFKGSCTVKLPRQGLQAVPVPAQGFMFKEKLGCICHCTVAFSFSPQAAFTGLSFMRLTGRTVGKLEQREEEGREKKMAPSHIPS